MIGDWKKRLPSYIRSGHVPGGQRRAQFLREDFISPRSELSSVDPLTFSTKFIIVTIALSQDPQIVIRTLMETKLPTTILKNSSFSIFVLCGFLLKEKP